MIIHKRIINYNNHLFTVSPTFNLLIFIKYSYLIKFDVTMFLGQSQLLKYMILYKKN
jgi:hypothetical protein